MHAPTKGNQEKKDKEEKKVKKEWSQDVIKRIPERIIARNKLYIQA